ncbi:hypothetical protein Theco_4051 (plasmid) [Thermobacillus composti KWC4]|jgi:DNA repair exonuclease SbcCD ATPase subunit|uniref:Uncharacterized protein n=1 Tax=Thermobacillus composti (strain DSM 18247 / JCM 13945 / KWC4) TaxID=717605 RepID=L0EKJ6_THECK|nr:hypothetical protein [Thermobacillus composti]AGA60052.1 hypothetical protein Theco_4051 [Thermobacillus composti KWC4]
MAQKGFNGLTDEQKSKVDKAIEVFISKFGGNHNDWLEKVADLFLLEEMKEGNPQFTTEIKELQNLTGRIVKMVMNMVERVSYDAKEAEEKYEQLKVQKNLEIEQLIGETQEQKRKIQELEQNIEKNAKEWAEREKYIKQLEESADINRELISEYKEKVEQLGGLVAEYRAAYEERNGLKSELEKANKRIEELEKMLDSEREQRKGIEKSVSDKIQALEQKHKEDIARVMDRAQVEKEREVLRIQSEMQKRIAELQEKHTAEIKELYERIDQLRNAKVENKERKGSQKNSLNDN